MKNLLIIILILIPILNYSQISISLSSPSSNQLEVYFESHRNYNSFPTNLWNSTEFILSYPNTLNDPSITVNGLFNISKDGSRVMNGAYFNQPFLSSNTNITQNFTTGSSLLVLTITFSTNINLNTISIVSGYIENASLGNVYSSSPLPITISTFSANKHSERASKLDWKTSSEINSDNFGIERSRDGDTWETISQVAAAGNSREEKYYEYIDDKLPFSRSKDQIFYYRLRLTDQDGSFKYSDIKGVNFNRQTADGVIAVYPNPATQMVHIDVVGMDESQGETKLRIFDMYGRVMLDKAILGSGLEPVDVLQYPSGVYNISVTQGDKLHQKQFIKVE
jgi:hypothetical protein